MNTRSQSPFRLPALTTPTSPSPSSPKQPQPQTQPLTPPPPLYLRPLIPSPPLPTSIITSPPPSPPYPWIWRCHICGSIYRLGVTRRCLDDGHYFCSLPSPPPSPVSPVDSSENVNKLPKSHAEVRRERKSRRKRRKEGIRGCRAEFDYKGWEGYNGWRREAQVTAQYNNMTKGEEGVVKGKGRLKNCWKYCDFPSECHNEAKAEREWEACIERERMRGLEEEHVVGKKEEGGMSARVIDDQNLDETMEGDLFVVGHEEMDMGGIESESESDGSSFLEDDAEMEDVELEDTITKGKEKEGLSVLGPIGTDCDGLGESGIFNTHRRKSVDSSMDSPPSSPLKTCNFGFEDKEMGCDGGAMEAKKRELKIDEDVQMQEALTARSDFLRWCERGDVGEFGDEVPVF